MMVSFKLIEFEDTLYNCFTILAYNLKKLLYNYRNFDYKKTIIFQFIDH